MLLPEKPGEMSGLASHLTSLVLCVCVCRGWGVGGEGGIDVVCVCSVRVRARCGDQNLSLAGTHVSLNSTDRRAALLAGSQQQMQKFLKTARGFLWSQTL